MTQWNVKVRCPEAGRDYPIVEMAEKFFDTSKKLLVVREKGKDWHWHIHGYPLEPKKKRKIIEEMNRAHPDRETDEHARPVSCREGNSQGFQYTSKGGTKAITAKWNITDEEFAELKQASDAYRAEKTAGSRKRVAEVDVDGLSYEGAALKMMRCVLDHATDEKKMIPMQARQIVLSELYKHKEYQDSVCKSMLKL